MGSDGSGSSNVAASIREGEVLAGKYRIERVIGEGGMGVVVAAHHLMFDERVAIKFLLPEGLRNAEAVARFEREARAAVKIKNEHVARMIDVGRLETGAPYIVMEYLEGSDLAGMLRTRGALPIEDAVEFVLQASEAIAEAHALGIVHRDLKPANLFVVRRADALLSVKVLDFGISKFTGKGTSDRNMGMTKTSAVMGSPLYMSPEQMESSRDVDARTDIWALGVILYELITGQVPFLAESMPELILKIISAQPAPLLNRRPDAPPGLEAVILRCLTKDRSKRYSNVAELAVALVEFGPKRSRTSAERISRTVQAAGLSASALASPPSSDTTEALGAATGVAWGKSQRVPGRSRVTLYVGGAVVGVAAIAVAVVARGGRTMSESPTAAVSGIVASTTDSGPELAAQAITMKSATTPPIETAMPSPSAVLQPVVTGTVKKDKQSGASHASPRAAVVATTPSTGATSVATPAVAPQDEKKTTTKPPPTLTMDGLERH